MPVTTDNVPRGRKSPRGTLIAVISIYLYDTYCTTDQTNVAEPDTPFVSVAVTVTV